MGKWTEEQIEILKKYASTTEVEDLVNLIGRDRKGIVYKAWKLGIPLKDNRRKWTEEEISFLSENYDSIGPCEISKILNRDQRSVSAKGSELGLSRSIKWTSIEDEFLKKNYENMSGEEIGKALNRSCDAVRKRAQKLNLTHSFRPWDEEEIDYLTDKWGKAQLKTIAEKLDRTEDSILHKAFLIGLREQSIGNGEYLTPPYIAGILGINRRCVYKLLYQDFMKYRVLKIGSSERYQIKNKWFLEFLECHPEKWDTRKADMTFIKSCFVSSVNINTVILPEWITKKVVTDTKNKSRKKQTKRKEWTYKEEQLLLSMKGNKATVKEIAKKLHRTYASVKHKVDVMKMENRIAEYMSQCS